MTTTISTWGNSQGMRFPKDIMKELHLAIGDKLNILVQDHKMILEPLKKEKQKYKIKELVSKLPKEYLASETFSSQVGTEEW